MAKFAYKALDGSGQEVKGSVEAASQAEAINKIRAMKLSPTALGQIDKSQSAPAASPPAKKGSAAPAASGSTAKKKGGMSMEIKMPRLWKARVKPKDLMTMTRQLATLVDAGLPLTRGLRVLQRQTVNPTLQDTLTGMIESVESGSTFSESLDHYPKIFDHLFVNMVRAGEAGGVLEVVLNRLAEFSEKAEKVKNKVKSAMVYPIVVLVAAVIIVTVLMLLVIPKFEQIFNDLMGGKGMPMITQLVIDFSRFMQDQWAAIFIGIGCFIVLWKLFAKTPIGSRVLDRVALKIPVMGSLTLRSSVARLTRTLGTLLASGVPVLQALSIVRETTGNCVVSTAVQGIHDSVKEGEGMSAPMTAAKIFPPMVVSMVEVGEETGALPDMLIRVANTYDDEVDNAVAAMTSTIEPIMIIFLAVIVGTIVIAMFMPMISIIGNLGAAGAQ